MSDQKTLRALVEIAMLDIATYKNPDVSEAQVKLHAVLLAAGMHGIAKDKIDSLHFDDGDLRIDTSWGARGNVCSDQKKIPESVIDADDPLAAAKLWGSDRRIKHAKEKIWQATETIENFSMSLEELIVERRDFDPDYQVPSSPLLPQQGGQQTAPALSNGGEVPIAPSACPITGRKFWGNIEHPDLGMVATYGGPFDTYTIPVPDEDGAFRCERFDQDRGHWIEGGEPTGMWIADEQPDPAAVSPQGGEAEQTLAQARELLQDPNVVHVSMLSGSIAKIGMRECAHVHGDAMMARWHAFEQWERDIAAPAIGVEAKAATALPIEPTDEILSIIGGYPWDYQGNGNKSDVLARYERLRSYLGTPAAQVAQAVTEKEKERLLLLDKAASLLNEAMISEDGIDDIQAMRLIEAIRIQFAEIGKTTTENTLDLLWSEIREAAGIPEDDEFNLRHALQLIAGAGVVKVSKDRPIETIRHQLRIYRADSLSFSAKEMKAALKLAADRAPRPTDDKLWDQTMQERDAYHEMADRLANAIAEYFGWDIGEHTSANCPWLRAVKYLGELPSLTHSVLVPPFQARVQPFMLQCFGAEIAADMLERGDRLLEETLELLQSKDYPRERVSQLEAYVYGRPAGDPPQEVGGVMVTLAAFCLAAGLDMHADGETELARILDPEVILRIHAKQAAKPKHSALPTAAKTAQRYDRIDWREISQRGLIERINREVMHGIGLAVYWDTETGVSGGALVSPDGEWCYPEDVAPSQSKLPATGSAK